MGNFVEILKYSKDLINSDSVQTMATIMGLTGYSFRDFKGIFNLIKFNQKFEKEFPEGLKEEEQNKILSDCFIELEDYIKENKNFDDHVFEKIMALLINGLKKEDILTREYIKILKELSWLELDVFIEIMKEQKIKTTYASPGRSQLIADVITTIKKKGCIYPKELIKKSIEKLISLFLLCEPINNLTGEILIKTSLGEELNTRLNNN